MKIERISVCFLSKDMEVSMNQMLAIDKSSLRFEMVPFFAAERKKYYQSYSQLANEAASYWEAANGQCQSLPLWASAGGSSHPYSKRPSPSPAGVW